MRISKTLTIFCLLISFQSIQGQTVDEVRLDYYEGSLTAKQVGMDVSKSGRYMAFAFDDGTIKVFDVESNRFKPSIQFDPSDLFEIKFSQDEKTIVLVKKYSWQVIDRQDGSVLHEKSSPTLISGTAIANKGNLMAVGFEKGKVEIIDLSTFEVIHEPIFEKAKKYVVNLDFSVNDQYLLMQRSASSSNKFSVIDLRTKQIVFDSNISGMGAPAFSEKEESVICSKNVEFNFKTGATITKNTQNPSFIDDLALDTKELLWIRQIEPYDGQTIVAYKYTGFMVYGSDGKPKYTTRRDGFVKDGPNIIDRQTIKRVANTSVFLIQPFRKNINFLFDIEKLQVLGYFYTDSNDDWAVVARDGRVDGSNEAFSKLYWTERKSSKQLPLDVNLAANITPKLLGELIYGDVAFSSDNLAASISMAPDIKITSPKTGTASSEKTIEINYVTTANGDPVKSVDVTVNGKKVGEGSRGFVKTGSAVTVSLVPGQNIISLTAVSDKGFESVADQVIVNYSGTPAQSELYLLTIGVNEYKNPKYSLNYANADAEAFEETMAAGGKGIFTEIKHYHIQNDQATKANIESTFDQINLEIGPEDVFVFYYAGHGVMSVDEKPKFYIVPHEVTRLYGDNFTLGEKAISADQLKAFSGQLSAQKQLFVLDACQSGGMTEMLATRGAAEERAIAQLARSTGTYWLTASGSEQFATEFASLGHGLFTYSLLEGLSGKADGGTKDNKVTVKELSAYLDDRVPELSEQHKGQAQYPTSYGFGQDFPIVVVE